MELKELLFPCLYKLLLFYIKAFPSVMMYWETEKIFFAVKLTQDLHVCLLNSFL